ncbi:unnamed protein product [Lathyrus sativus]|nr:unnamed protein product [Lathyrus sativus]
MVCQQFGGINGIVFYASSIFDLAGFPSTVGSIYFAIIQVLIFNLTSSTSHHNTHSTSQDFRDDLVNYGTTRDGSKIFD